MPQETPSAANILEAEQAMLSIIEDIKTTGNMLDSFKEGPYRWEKRYSNGYFCMLTHMHQSAVGEYISIIVSFFRNKNLMCYLRPSKPDGSFGHMERVDLRSVTTTQDVIDFYLSNVKAKPSEDSQHENTTR